MMEPVLTHSFQVLLTWPVSKLPSPSSLEKQQLETAGDGV